MCARARALARRSRGLSWSLVVSRGLSRPGRFQVSLGYSAGPLINVAFGKLSDSLPGFLQKSPLLHPASLPAWFLALLCIAEATCIVCFFNEPPMIVRRPPPAAARGGPGGGAAPLPRPALPWASLSALYFVGFLVPLNIAAWEVRTVLITEGNSTLSKWGNSSLPWGENEGWGWHPWLTGLYEGALLLTVALFCLIPWANFVTDRVGVLVFFTIGIAALGAFFRENGSIPLFTAGSFVLLNALQVGMRSYKCCAITC